MTDPNLAKLRELLLNEFTEAELASLCQDIGLNYSALPGTGAFGKTREMIEAARSGDKLRALQSRVRELRPEAYAALGLGPLSYAAAAPAATAATTAAAAPPPPTSPASQVAPPTIIGAPAAAAASAPGGSSARADARRRDSGAGPLPLIALGLAALLCTVVGLAVLLPRLNEVPAPAASAVPTAAVAGAASDATPDAAAPTQAAALAPTAVLTEGASVLVPMATEVPAVIVPTVEPVPADGQAPLDASGAVTAGVATPAMIVTPAADAGAIAAGTGVTVTGAGVTGTTPSVTGIVTATSDHPAALTVRNMNEQLQLFYTGKIAAEEIEQYWTGEALRSVSGFGNTRLARALRLQPTQRDAIEVSYQYQTPPTLASASGDTAVVTSREAWRYANSLNTTQICEVRDYVYNLVNENGRYRVREFNSRLLQSGCQPQ